MKNVGACSDRHVPSETVVRQWCKDRACPVCYPIWAGKSAGRAKERLSACLEIYDGMHGENQLDVDGNRRLGIPGFHHPGGIKHFVFSPPQKWAIGKMKTAAGVRSLRRELVKVLGIAGMRAAASIIHPWRCTELARREFPAAKKRGDKGTNHGLWHWLLRTGLCYSIDYVYLSPHFHVIGLGYLMNSDIFYEHTEVGGRDGWIYNNIRTIDSEKDLNDVLFYALTHTAIVYDTKTGGSLNSITYHGDISYPKMKRVLAHTDCKHVACPKCETSVYEWVGWSQEFKYDKESKEERWMWAWNSDMAKRKPLITYDVMEYKIEKHDYWLKGNDAYHSIQLRGKEPIRDDRSGERTMIAHDHDGQAFDWVTGTWIGADGEVGEWLL